MYKKVIEELQKLGINSHTRTFQLDWHSIVTSSYSEEQKQKEKNKLNSEPW